MKFPMNSEQQQVCTSCGQIVSYTDCVVDLFHQHKLTGLCSKCLLKLKAGKSIILKLEEDLLKINMGNKYSKYWINVTHICTKENNYQWEQTY